MKKKAVLALTLAGLVALQLPMVAMAETISESGTYDHNIDGGGNNAVLVDTAGKNIVINGDVENNSSGRCTAFVSAKSEVTVNGSVANGSSCEAINISNEAKVIANSATNNGTLTTVRANNATVTVNGAVENKGTGNAVNASNGAKVTAENATSNGDAPTVNADNATVTVNTAVTNRSTGRAITANNGAKVTTENAKNNSDTNATVGAIGKTGEADPAEQTTITVIDNVTNTGKGKAIYASNGAIVTAGSAESNGTEATVNAESAAQVTVGGNATNDGDGSNTGSVVIADGAGTKVSVDGNIVQNGEAAKYGCYAVEVSNGAEVDAGSIVSNCSNGVALYVEKSGTVKVDGNIEGNNTIWLKEITAPTTIAVSGEVKLTNPADYKKAVCECDQSDLSNVELSVWGINGKVADGVKVNYIVKDSDNTASYKNMSFDSSQVETVEINGKTYYTAKQGTITVTVNSGYELTSTKGITGSGNTYTVEIPEGGYVTLEAILKAIEEEQKATVTGTEGNAVNGGQWNVGPGGYWTYRNNGIFKDTWGYITLANGQTGWFYFDKNGVMATGWKKINDKWYYFNEVNDGTQGMMLVNTTTPDGNKVGADGAWIQ